MQSFLFWTHWDRPYRTLYTLLFGLLIAVICWFGYAYFQGYNVFLDWQIQGQAETTEVGIGSVQVGPFTINNSADNTIYTQRFASSAPATNAWSYYTFLTITTLCACVLITIISTLPRFSFYVGAGFIVLYIMNMKLELLYLFGLEQKVGLIIGILLFLPAAYYFNRIRSHISFSVRLITFALLFLIFALVIYFGAQVQQPFLYVAAASILNPLAIGLIFTLIVAHEIIGAIILVLTRSNTSKSKNTLTHFSVITVVYLANVTLAYLRETNIIEWDIVYVNPFLLLTISAVLGIWLYKYREEQYGYLFKFLPIGALFYASMAICCFATIAHLHTTANDPGLENFRDFILYGHLGYGAIFVLYIIANFVQPLKDNMKVYKVLYAPVSMPFFTYRLAGLIAFIALTVKSNWEVPLNQGIAAYYNGLGDLHLENNEPLLAESYFEEAANYGYNNHKSNFTLATFHAERKEYEKAAVRYEDALAKWPSAQGYVNLGNLHLDDGRFFDALFTAKEGVKRFGNSFQIQNNLGLLYGKTGILDSSIYYLDNAYNKGKNETASSNILAVVARSDFGLDADSVLSEYDIASDPISVNNNYVLYNNSLKALELPYLAEDTVLKFLDASILFNRSFNHLYSEDSLNTEEIFELANKPYNAGARERLEYVACLNLYKNKNVNKAFRELNWLANGSITNSGKFFNLIGTWALDQEAPDVAVQYFEWAENKDWSEASFNKAIALSENGRILEAIESWEQIEKSQDEEAQEIARTMLAILRMDLSNFDQLNDDQKYLVIRYRLLSRDITLCKNLASTISNANYRAQAYLDMCKKLWKDDAIDLAISLYQELGGLEITDRRLYEETQWFELRMLAFSKKVRLLAEKINQGIVFDNEHILEKHFYTGLLMEASGDTTAARENYQFIAYMNPFFEEAVIHSAEFTSLRDGFEAYDILLSALEINPNSIKLLKAFIIQCAKVELNTYAENSLDDLSRLISATEFSKFKQEYEELVKQVVEEAENF
ncbi:MAG: hypothetical protein AAGG59_17135 [Bacteroidota bacterium]